MTCKLCEKGDVTILKESKDYKIMECEECESIYLIDQTRKVDLLINIEDVTINPDDDKT